jgi:hypothetical protein
MPRTNLNCGILTAAIIFSHSADNYSQLSLLQLRTSRGFLPPRNACKRASVSPINPWSDTRETLRPTVLQLLRHCWHAWRHCWLGHVTPPHSCVIQVFIAVAWQQTRWGDARLVTTRQSSARRKHRFIHCCVIAGTCFDVTVLAWRKYTTIQCENIRVYTTRLKKHIHNSTYEISASILY